MTNGHFGDIHDFRDIESLNHYDTAVRVLGQDPADVLAALRSKSRDNARTPMQWTAEESAGFSDVEPWIPVNPNTRWLNAAAQHDDPRSVYSYYRELIRLRHVEPVVVEGDFALLWPDHPQLYAFTRSTPQARLTVLANLSGDPVEVPGASVAGGTIELLTNRPGDVPPGPVLGPWEARVLAG